MFTSTVRVAKRLGVLDSKHVRNAGFRVFDLATPESTTVAVGRSSELAIQPTERPQYYFGYDRYEAGVTEWLQSELTPESTFYDIGAEIGYYVVIAAECLSDAGTIVACDPLPDHIESIHEQCRRNGITADIREIAVSDADGMAELSLSGSPGLSGEADRTIPVRTRSLDSLLDDTGHNIDVMKVDVEGAEGRVFAGAADTLTTQQPTILLEVHPEKIQGFETTIEDVLTTVRDYGYTLYSIPDETKLSIHGVLDLCDSGGWFVGNPHIICRAATSSERPPD